MVRERGLGLEERGLELGEGWGCDADAVEEGVVVVVGVVPGILVWGGGTDWGEGRWLRW